jgi:hypothetical protein
MMKYYEPGHPGNSDKTTDHFIVIHGRGYDSAKGQYYYNFVETGRGYNAANDAISDSNRLYYDSSEGTFTGKRWDGKKTYTLAQIRLNK